MKKIAKVSAFSIFAVVAIASVKTFMDGWNLRKEQDAEAAMEWNRKEIKRTTDSIDATLPKVIDSNTIFLKAYAMNTDMVLVMKLSRNTKSDIDSADFVHTIEQFAKESQCKTLAGILRKNCGVFIRYVDMNLKDIASIHITKSFCAIE